MRRPNRTHAELRIPDGVDDIVTANRGLIATAFKTFFPWLSKQCEQLREDLESVGLFSLAKAARDHDPAKAKYSTLAMRYLRNDLTNHINALTCQKIVRFRPNMEHLVSAPSLEPFEILAEEERAEAIRLEKIRRALRKSARNRRYRARKKEQLAIAFEDVVCDEQD